MSDKFFERKKPAAVLKHELLRRYLRVYVQKTGSTSKDKRVAYVDCYAGPGNYDDGSLGSPGVAVETANVVRSAGDRIDGYFIEREQASVDALRGYLRGEGLSWPVDQGEVREMLPQILDRIDPATSAFVFLDPFGLGVPMDLLARILARSGDLRFGYRTQGAATEVLLNFSFPGLRRNAGHLTSTKITEGYEKTRQTFIKKLDSTLGGDWWQEIWTSEAVDREQKVLKGYLRRLGELPGRWESWAVPVSNRWEGDPLYCLVQLTQHRDGRWEFHEALSNAMEPYRTTCLEGTLDLDPLAQRDSQWIAEIQSNIEGLLAEGKPFRVQDRMPEVFGTTLGSARSKHVRAAVKALHLAGGTVTTGTGKVQHMQICPSN